MNYIMLILNLLSVLSYHVRRKSYTLLNIKFNNIGAIRINAPHPFKIVYNKKATCDLYELQHADSEFVIGFTVSRQSKKL